MAIGIIRGTSAKLWLRISQISYGLCLAVPAYTIDYYTPRFSFGLEALILGPLGVFAGHFSWFANPLLWASWRKLKGGNPYGSIAASIFALLVALTFLLMPEVPVGSAGMYTYSIHVGYCLWLFSISSILFGSAVLIREGASVS